MPNNDYSFKWKVSCDNCWYSKDGLCDYPYIGNVVVGVDDIKRLLSSSLIGLLVAFTMGFDIVGRLK